MSTGKYRYRKIEMAYGDEFLNRWLNRAQRTGAASPFRANGGYAGRVAKEQVAALPERQTVPTTTATVSSVRLLLRWVS